MDTFQLLSGWLKELAQLNIYLISSTLDTFHLLSVWLKDLAFLNKGLGPAAKAFCKALLHKDPSKRLGSNGVKDILDHAFFGGLDLDEVLADAVQTCVEIEFRAPYAIDATLSQ